MLLSGGLAGILSWIPIYPFDVIKTKIQADGYGKERIYHGFIHCFKETIKNDPFMLYRGIGSSIYRAFVLNATIFSVYNQIQLSL